MKSRQTTLFLSVQSFRRETGCLTSRLLPWLFKIGSTLIVKNLLLKEQIHFFRVDPIGTGGKNENGGVASPESVSVRLKP